MQRLTLAVQHKLDSSSVPLKEFNGMGAVLHSPGHGLRVNSVKPYEVS